MVFQLVPPQPPPPQPPKIKSSDSAGSGLVIILLVVGLRAIVEPTSDSRTKVGPTRWRSKPAGQELGGQLAPSIALAVSRRSTHAKRNDEKKITHIFGQCKVLAIGGGRGGTSDVCSGDGRRGRYHTDGRMKRRHILVKVCVHLANRMQASFVGSALSSKRLSWNFEGFIFGGGPPKCYLEQATKVQNYKTEHVLCFCGHFLEANHFFKLRIEPSTFLNKAVCVY